MNLFKKTALGVKEPNWIPGKTVTLKSWQRMSPRRELISGESLMVEVNFQRLNVDHLLKMFDYERGENI